MMVFLESKDAQEVTLVSQLDSEWVSQGTDRDFTDVTLVSEDTYQRLDWCDPGEMKMKMKMKMNSCDVFLPIHQQPTTRILRGQSQFCY